MNKEEIKVAETIFEYAKIVKKPFTPYNVANSYDLDFNITKRVLDILQKNEGYFRFANDRKTFHELTKDGRNFTTWADHLTKEDKEKKDLEDKRQPTAKQLEEIELVLKDWDAVKKWSNASVWIAGISALIALAALIISLA